MSLASVVTGHPDPGLWLPTPPVVAERSGIAAKPESADAGIG